MNKSTYGVNSYCKLSDVEHVLQRPDMYIGALNAVTTERRLMCEELDSNGAGTGSYRFIHKEISMSEGVLQLYRELLINASDNVQNSIDKGVESGPIHIEVTETTVKVTNGGMGIPVAKWKDLETGKEEIYIPELIFGVAKTSSNYDNTRGNKKVAGRNGYGAKLCNIFSRTFSIAIIDSDRELRYDQTWEDNMKTRYSPDIEEDDGQNTVHVEYELDFDRFDGVDSYTDEVIAVFMSHAADAAYTCRVPVYFNGYLIDYRGENDYITSLFSGAPYVSYIKGAKKKIPDIEIHVADTPYGGRIHAFINGNETPQGGAHVDSSVEAFLRPLIKSVNSSREAKALQGKRGITIKDVMPHITLYVSYRCDNPEFTGQGKGKFNKPKPDIGKISGSKIETMKKWSLLDRLTNIIKDKALRNQAKTDGKKKRHIYMSSSEDANFAGHRSKAKDCSLIIVEGRSAMSYAVKLISSLEGGRNYYGAFPLKGKPLNVVKHPDKVADNKEIIGLKKMLGLRSGMDYSTDKNFNTLRYGQVIILADADVDGIHILGLMISMFNYHYKSLLERGFLKYMRTPIVRLTKGTESNKFYTIAQYREWASKEDAYRWRHDYLKGLGSSTDKYILDEAQNPLYVYPFLDALAQERLDLAFHPDMANRRKDWVAQEPGKVELCDGEEQNISTFIDTELIEYGKDNLSRSIPCIMDGCKESIRKIIYGCYHKWGTKVGSPKATKMKVGELGPYVASVMGYHHGPKSIEDSIIAMTNSYVGSNNMRYFVPNGQFGTRNMCGKDAAKGRYSAVIPEWWWPYIYKKQDTPLLTIRVDDGKEIEPEYLLPIIPMCLINGVDGIATGWSTYIPNYNPVDVVDWYIDSLTDKEQKDIKPWYKGFKGKIEIVETETELCPRGTPCSVIKGVQLDTTALKRSPPVCTEEEEEDELGNNKMLEEDIVYCRKKMVTKGIYHTHEGTTLISELPIGTSMHNYYFWLNKQYKEGVISDLSNNCTDSKVNFKINGPKIVSHRRLRLTRTYSMCHMVLLDIAGDPIEFGDVTAILKYFRLYRLHFYGLRKKHIISTMEETLHELDLEAKFIHAVVEGELKIFNMSIKDYVYPEMDKMGFPRMLLRKVGLIRCTQEEIPKLQARIDELTHELQKMIDTSPEQLWLDDLYDFREAYVAKIRKGW